METEDLPSFEPGSIVYVAGESFRVRALRRGKKGPQVAFEEVTDRDGAESIRGRDVYVAAPRELGDREYWPRDLVGLEVRPDGGRVVDVAHGVAQDRLVVERRGIQFEVPFVDELVPVVDLDGGFVEITEIEGLSSPSDRQ